MSKIFIVVNFIRKFSQYILFKLCIFLSILLKIFGSSNIFEEIPIFEGLRRFFKIPKNLRLRLQSIFQIRRFFVFVFGPFSIFVATLSTGSPGEKCLLKIPFFNILTDLFCGEVITTKGAGLTVLFKSYPPYICDFEVIYD